MDGAQFLGLTAISTLVLALAGLVVSLLASNPLLGSDPRGSAVLLSVGVLLGAGLLVVLAGTRGQRTATPYW